MENCRKSKALSCKDEAYYELYNASALINAVITCCKDKEFRGVYYGMPKKFTQLISNERNEYLSLLSLSADKLNLVNNLNLRSEKADLLHQNTDNCSR